MRYFNQKIHRDVAIDLTDTEDIYCFLGFIYRKFLKSKNSNKLPTEKQHQILITHSQKNKNILFALYTSNYQSLKHSTITRIDPTNVKDIKTLICTLKEAGYLTQQDYEWYMMPINWHYES